MPLVASSVRMVKTARTSDPDSVLSAESLLVHSTFYGWSRGHGTNMLSTYRGERLVQAVEHTIGADDVGQAVTVEIGLQRRLRVYEHQHDAGAGQVVLECPQHTCR